MFWFGFKKKRGLGFLLVFGRLNHGFEKKKRNGEGRSVSGAAGLRLERIMAALVKTPEEWIAELAPDLQGLLDSRKVHKDVQVELAKHSIDSVSMLSAVALDRGELEKVAKDLLGVDTATGGDAVVKFAQLFLAWQSAAKRVKVQDEADAEAASRKEPKSIPLQELQGLRQTFETQFYKMKEAEIPARASIEDLFEQIDMGELRPMSLRHFGSKADDEDAEVGSLQLGKAGQIKIRKSRMVTSAPSTMEEFRAKVVLMANHYMFARFRYPNRDALQKLNPFVFLDYLGYLTGKHVAQLESETVDGVTLHKPSIKLLVNYEYQMRKEVAEQVNLGGDFAEELARVSKNADIRERHFSTPLAVSSASQSLQWSNKEKKGEWWSHEGPKGKGKKGKGKGKGKGGKKGEQSLHSSTPDGRQICFAWNNKKEGCKGGCNRVHACRICLDTSHPTYEHPVEGGQKAAQS